ncbi:MAG: hypothetical protein Kow0090_08180 [Myxococcota bacterium]
MRRRYGLLSYIGILLLTVGCSQSNPTPTNSATDPGNYIFNDEESDDKSEEAEESYYCESDKDCEKSKVCCDGICLAKCGDDKLDGGDVNGDDDDSWDDGGEEDIARQECESDYDCPVGNYCDFKECYKGSGEECVKDSDCPSSEVCGPTLRCRTGDDNSGKEGFPCRPDNSCDEGLTCEEGFCIPPDTDDDDDSTQICIPGELKCDGSSVVKCNGDGARWEVQVKCAEGEICIGGECINKSCTPDEKRCDQNKVLTCNGEGSGWYEYNCPGGEICKDGECRAPVCNPSEKRCKDTKTIEMCRSDGTGWQDIYVCKNNDECSDAKCACFPKCEGKECGWDGCDGECGKCNNPPAVECVDSKTLRNYLSNGVCAALSKCEYEWVDTVCENGCEGGKCLNCVPNCEGKLCGADGCGGSCGTCGEFEGCDPVTFTCVQTCFPNCAGKECGSDGCGGTCLPNVCNNSPGNVCADANTKREHEAQGVCNSSGVCEYSYTDTPCQYGCENGACKTCTPACEGKNCGDDGCGGVCGTCSDPLNTWCDNGVCKGNCAGVLNAQNNHCYKIATLGLNTWRKARDACHALNSNAFLASVTSQAEHDWLKTKIVSGKNYAIGAVTNNNQWTWENGDAWGTFTNWCTPPGPFGICDLSPSSNKAVRAWDSGLLWYPIGIDAKNDDYPYRYICEWDICYGYPCGIMP